MKAVVSGGAGFIGSHLVEKLTEGGHEVLVIDNLVAGAKRVGVLEGLGIPLEKIDIRDDEAAGVVEKFGPQVVFNLAAQMDVRRSVADPVYDAEVNIAGSLRLLEAARKVGARFVHTSSGGCIYGDQPEDSYPLDEETRGLPDSPYGISKKVLEDYLRFYAATHSLRFVSLALSNVYGPRQDPHGEAGVVAIFGSRLLSGEPCTIFGDGKQTRDFVFAGDVVKALIAAVEKGEGETFNIGTGHQVSVEDLYWRMAKACGVDEEPVFAPARAGELARNALDPAKAGRMLGWGPKVGLEDGIALTVDHIRQDLERGPG